jgi:LPS sulfotransferase NodH
VVFSSYIIAATPRSGSTLLCDLLSGTGIAGEPHSYYRREDILDYARKWRVPSPGVIGAPAFERSYLEAVRRAGAAGTSIFGLRIMWRTVAELCARLSAIHPDPPDDAARIGLAFGNPLYIHLSRRDKVAQAVSRLKAEQSGLWHRAADGTERERTAPPAPLVYDADRLAGLVNELELDDAAWSGWFARFGIEPLRLTYEGLAAAPRAALTQVLFELALDPRAAASIDARTARLADETSLEWAYRFREGMGPGGIPAAGNSGPAIRAKLKPNL